LEACRYPHGNKHSLFDERGCLHEFVYKTHEYKILVIKKTGMQFHVMELLDALKSHPFSLVIPASLTSVALFYFSFSSSKA
jgi:inner membrane protein involved in colicin E2 resistance